MVYRAFAPVNADGLIPDEPSCDVPVGTLTVFSSLACIMVPGVPSVPREDHHWVKVPISAVLYGLAHHLPRPDLHPPTMGSLGRLVNSSPVRLAVPSPRTFRPSPHLRLMFIAPKLLTWV